MSCNQIQMHKLIKNGDRCAFVSCNTLQWTAAAEFNTCSYMQKYVLNKFKKKKKIRINPMLYSVLALRATLSRKFYFKMRKVDKINITQKIIKMKTLIFFHRKTFG